VLCKQEEEVLETTYITKLLNNTNANIAYTTNSTVRKPLKQRRNHDLYLCNCKERCPVCPVMYIGGNGRLFSTIFKEHSNTSETNSGQSKISDHILEENHFVMSMENIMNLIAEIKKKFSWTQFENSVFIKQPNLVSS
jgi:hypothetical protein